MKALELQYSRLRPTLSAVEQTVKDDLSALSEQDLLNKLRTMMTPGIADLLGYMPKPIALVQDNPPVNAPIAA
jgi:hypothetical protein